MTKEEAEVVLRNEWDLLKKSGLLSQIGCSAGPVKTNGIYNLFKWKALMRAPESSPYKGYLFQFEINFPEDYPNRVPEIYFITPIYHPNVNIHKSGSCSPPLGSISFNTINCWNPSTSIIKALTDLYANFYWANPDCCFSLKFGEEYKFNRPLYEKKV